MFATQARMLRDRGAGSDSEALHSLRGDAPQAYQSSTTATPAMFRKRNTALIVSGSRELPSCPADFFPLVRQCVQTLSRAMPSAPDIARNVLRSLTIAARGPSRPASPALLPWRRQVGAVALGRFGGHADALAERRMRVDRLANVDRIGAHLDRQRDLAD